MAANLKKIPTEDLIQEISERRQNLRKQLATTTITLPVGRPVLPRCDKCKNAKRRCAECRKGAK